MAEMPTSVQVGPFRFRVTTDRAEINRFRVENGDAHMVGQARLHEQVIAIDPALVLDQRRDTLLHEIRHVVDMVTGVYSGERETAEQNITRSTSTLLDTLRRNPALVACLVAEDEGG